MSNYQGTGGHIGVDILSKLFLGQYIQKAAGLMHEVILQREAFNSEIPSNYVSPAC